MEDSGLCEDLATDLDGAFERLVLAYTDRLFRFGLRLSSSPEDAEEVAQDAFVRAYHALQTYPPERIRALQLRPWLYRIALNAFRNHVRRKRVKIEPLDGADPIAEEADGPEQIALDGERVAEIASHLALLPQRYRTAVVLRHIEDLSYAEIATVLGQPLGTVKANVHRGVQELRRALAPPQNLERSARSAGRGTLWVSRDGAVPRRYARTPNP